MSKMTRSIWLNMGEEVVCSGAPMKAGSHSHLKPTWILNLIRKSNPWSNQESYFQKENCLKRTHQQNLNFLITNYFMHMVQFHFTPGKSNDITTRH